MIVTLLGILSSVFTEVATAINKKLTGTVLQGDGAFLLALGISLVGAAIKTAFAIHFSFTSYSSWQYFALNYGAIFSVSQVYFYLIMKKLGLDIVPTPVQPQDPTVLG